MQQNTTLKLLGISRHAYYYKPTNGRKGRPPSQFTPRQEPGRLVQVSEEEVLTEILKVKLNPETDYGYRGMTAALQLKNFVINKKKVYRIMEKYQLIHEKAKKTGRTYVKHRRVDPEVTLSVIEADIKFAHKIEKYLRKKWQGLDITVMEGIQQLDAIVGLKIKLGDIKEIIKLAQPNEQCKELLKKAGVVLPDYLPVKSVKMLQKDKCIEIPAGSFKLTEYLLNHSLSSTYPTSPL